MLSEPRIIEAPSRPTASVHLAVPREQIRTVMGPARKEVSDALAAQGLEAAGPFFSHHLKMPSANFDLEVGVPVDATIATTGRVRAQSLPGGKVATAVYQGPYEGLGEAWAEFMAWAAKAGHVARPQVWELYATGPEAGSDPSQWKTELYLPLA